MILLNRLAPMFALLLVFLIGCDAVVQEDAKPPTLIPAQAFTVQTELFEQGESDKAEIDTHAMIARLRVWPVTTALAGYLALPAAVTEAALEEEPTVEQGAWVWTATTTADETDVEFALTGRFHEGHVDWTMHVTEAGAEQDSTFTLYTAKTAQDGSSGSWELFAPVADTTQSVLRAEFQVDKEDGKEVVFQIPETAPEHAGDAVTYVQGEKQRSFRWFQVRKEREHVITWDAETQAGSITATNYNDGEKACWGDALQNETCSD